MNNSAQRVKTIELMHNFGIMSFVKPLVIVVILATSMSSCQMAKCGATKEGFLENYDAFITKVDKMDLEVDDQKWNTQDETFKTYIEECYDYHEEKMSTGEKRRFWMKTLKYYSTRYGEGMLNELSKDDITTERIMANVEEVLGETGKNIEDFVNKNAQEIEELFDEIGHDIEEWAEKLKDIFEQ